MPSIIKITYGILISAVDPATSAQYTDWRASYIDKPGMIVVAESDQKHPGKQYIYLYPNNPNSMHQEYFKTASGDMTHDGSYYILDTPDGRYTFLEEMDCVSEPDKELLQLNVFMNPNANGRRIALADKEMISFGKIVSATNILTGENYNDFRSDYVGVRGYVMLYSTPHHTCNNYFAFFLPIEGKNDSYLETSQGRIKQDGNTLLLESRNSRYKFELEDKEISDEDQKKLEMQIFMDLSYF